MNGNSRLRAVLIGGTIGGTLDILFALIFAAVNGVGPVRLLQTVASGLLGEEAYAGGTPAAALGLAGHFIMSYLWAALFVAIAVRLQRLTVRPILAGAIFGILVFFTMRLVVLPLSAFPHPVSFKPVSAGLDLLSHMFLFGVPIALAAARRKE
jgi:uncharacterized membrane protein YagU involved in acid resistance